MILIVGGEGSGKRSFAKTLGFKDNDMADAVMNACPVIFHLEQMVFADPDCVQDIIPQLEEKKCVLCNEVGSGVMPITDSERIGREATGRLCVLLAKKADCVVRMVSGLPMVIKGKLPEE